MTLRTRVEPIDRDIALIFAQELSPDARSRQLAEFGRQALKEGQEANRQVLGRVPPHRSFVDGSEGAAIDRVKPDGVIVFEFELVTDLLLYIAGELQAVSPVRSGRYRRSHTLFADGVEVPIGADIPIASEYVFLSDVPYARKIEGAPGRPPQSPQAPKGVYEITALKANSRFGNVARVRFSWRSPVLPYGGAASRHARRGGISRGGREWDTRVPAIVVRLGR